MRTRMYAFDKTSLLRGTTDILAQECTSVYILELQVCDANLLLLETTDIRVRSETTSP